MVQFRLEEGLNWAMALRLMVNIFLLWSREIFLRLTFDRYD